MPPKPTEPETGGKKPRRGKPQIWSDGRQAPRFETDAFLRAAGRNAHLLAARGLSSASFAIRRSAASFRDGSWQLPPERLGHTGRFLPDHQSVARTLTATARFVDAAGVWAAGPPPVEPMQFRGWDGQPPANEAAAPPAAISPLRFVRPPRGSAAASPAVDVDRETLEAIRTVVHAANVMPLRPVRTPLPQPEPEPEPRAARLPHLEPAEPQPPGCLVCMGRAAVGSLAIAAAWPVGAVQALMAHLRGENLREFP